MLLFGKGKTLDMPRADEALPGRAEPIATAETHFVSGLPLKGPYPDGLETAVAALGARLDTTQRLQWATLGTLIVFAIASFAR